jgi:large-conductance mechanosensitive channel
MFLTLLIVTFLVATAVSTIVVLAFRKPADQILKRVIADEVSTVWCRYLMFALYVVGISSGVHIRDLEKYLTTPPITTPPGKGMEILQLTNERWFLEVYRTTIGSLQGLAWALLVFFICALLAFVIVRNAEMLKSKDQTKVG